MVVSFVKQGFAVIVARRHQERGEVLGVAVYALLGCDRLPAVPGPPLRWGPVASTKA